MSNLPPESELARIFNTDEMRELLRKVEGDTRIRLQHAEQELAEAESAIPFCRQRIRLIESLQKFLPDEESSNNE